MRLTSSVSLSFLSAIAPLLVSGAVQAQQAVATPVPVGAPQRGLLWLCALLFVAMFLAMLIGMWRHRRAVRRRGESMDEPGWVELCWTLIPILIALGAAWPVFSLLFQPG